MDLFRRYGLIAVAGDRHLAEFCPHSWYLAQVESWGFALTPVSWRIRNQEKLKELANAYVEGTAVMTPVESGEEGIDGNQRRFFPRRCPAVGERRPAD
jgi:alpha-galactosidase